MVFAISLGRDAVYAAGHAQRAVFHHQRAHRALHHRIAGVDAAYAGHQVARQAPGQRRVDQARDAALADAAQVGHGHRQQVHRLRQVLAVEIAARDDLEAASVLGENQRIVGGCVDFIADDGVDVIERVEHRPVHLRRAAQRVDVLYARGVVDVGAAQLVRELHCARFVRGAGRAGHELPDDGGGLDLARMRARLVDALVEAGHFGAHRFERQAQRQAGVRQQVACVGGGQHGNRQRHGAAVDQRGRVLGLEVELHRCDAGLRDGLRRAHAAAAVDDFGFIEAGNGGGQVGQRSQVAGRADRSLLRHHRVDASVDEVQQAVHHLDPRRRVIAGEGIGPQQHVGAADFFRKRLAHAGCVRPYHLGLEQRNVLDADARVLQQADAGVEAVHHRRFVMHPVVFDVGAAFDQRVARGLRQRDLHAMVARHGQHLVGGEVEAIDA